MQFLHISLEVALPSVMHIQSGFHEFGGLQMDIFCSLTPYLNPWLLLVQMNWMVGCDWGQFTWEHSEDSSEGVELESINDITGVDQLQTHEAEAHHQQNNVQHLRDQWQPQHPCKTTHSGHSIMRSPGQKTTDRLKERVKNKKRGRNCWVGSCKIMLDSVKTAEEGSDVLLFFLFLLARKTRKSSDAQTQAQGSTVTSESLSSIYLSIYL